MAEEIIKTEYTDENIRHLSDMEHVRTRPGMYIGRLGDGSMPEDGIYWMFWISTTTCTTAIWFSQIPVEYRKKLRALENQFL